MIDEGVCDKGFIWNPSNCECEYWCDIGEYLDYENSKCKKKLVNKLVEESTETNNEVKLAKNNSMSTRNIWIVIKKLVVKKIFLGNSY